MTPDRRLRDAIAAACRSLHARGFVAYHEGNVTARLSPDRFLATPTGVSKGAIDAGALIVVDGEGRLVSGGGKPFSELGLHLCVYRERPDAGAVVHAHPPAATGFALARRPLDRPLLPEAVVALGPGIPTVPFAPPGPAAARELQPFAATHDAVLLAGHGALAWGPDLELAMLRMELVEQVARTALVAEQLGGARELPADVVASLLETRRRAGLGAKAPGPARQEQPRSSATALPSPSPDLARVIRQEVVRALRRTD